MDTSKEQPTRVADLERIERMLADLTAKVDRLTEWSGYRDTHGRPFTVAEFAEMDRMDTAR